MSTEDLLFPSLEYHLDESDPDVVILRRQEGAFVAAFSARGVTREGIVEAAEENKAEIDEGMGVEQALIFVGHHWRMFHLRFQAVGRSAPPYLA